MSTNVIKLENTKVKERISKTTRDRRQTTCKLYLDRQQPPQEWESQKTMDYLQNAERNNQLGFFWESILFFKNEDKIKTFPDNKKIRDFSTHNPSMKKSLKDMLEMVLKKKKIIPEGSSEI